MSDPLTWSPISLGRWFGTSVRVHVTLIFFVVFRLLATAVSLAAKGELSPIAANSLLAGPALAFAGDTRARPCHDGRLARLRPGRSQYLAAGQPGRALVRASVQREFPGRDGRPGCERGYCSGDRPGIELFSEALISSGTLSATK